MFSLSQQTADLVFRWSNFGLVVATILVVVTTAGVSWSGAIRERFSNERTVRNEATAAEAAKEIAKANAAAATAGASAEAAKAQAARSEAVSKQAESNLAASQARAEEAKAQAAEAKRDAADSLLRARNAEKQIAEANERTAAATERANAAALALERLKTPRSLSYEQQARLSAALRPWKGQVFSEAVAPDGESVAFLGILRSVLTEAGWVVDNSAVVIGLGGAAISPGVGIQIGVADASAHGTTMAGAAQALAKALEMNGLQATAIIDTALVRPDIVNVHVGVKPY